MAYVQKTSPPPNRIIPFTLSNFTGGINNRSEFIGDNEASDILNVMFLDDSVMEKRNGIDYFDTLNLNDSITFMDEYRPYTDADVLLRATNTKLYKLDTQIATVAGQIDGVNYRGKYIFVDGKDMYVYGKFPQVDTTYENIIGTAVNDYVLMKVINPTEGYTPLPETNTRGVTNYDYTNSVIYYEPCVNEVKDTYKGANVLPQNPSLIEVHKGRLFVSGSDKDNDNVFISDLNLGYYFPVALPIQLPPNSDKVTDLIVYDDSVVVGRTEDVFVITGDTNIVGSGFDVFRLRKLNTHTGFASKGCASIAHNYLFYLGLDGNAYALASTRNDQKILATTIITDKLDLFKKPFNLTADDMKTAKSYFFKDMWYVSIKDIVLIYSYRHRGWTKFNHMNARSMYNLNEKLIWGTDSGRMCSFTTSYYDYGKPFYSFWRSKNFDMGEPSTFKQFREFYIIGHTFEDFVSDVNVKFDIDYVEVKDRHEIRNMMSIWGKAKWGDRFISRNIVASLPFIIGRRGRLIRFTLWNGYEESTSVLTYADLENYLGRKDGTLVYVTDELSYYLYNGVIWEKQENSDLNQPMRWYQINGDYEFRGKR